MTRRTLSVLLAVVVLSASGCALSQRDEVRIGDFYSRELDIQLPLVRDAELNRYLATLGDSIARVVDRRHLTWRFVLVASPEVNALALPGGYVYVTTGLVQRTPEMHQLAAVLGHEIAHVTRRHVAHKVERAGRVRLGVALACVLTAACDHGLMKAGIRLSAALVSARYDRDDERRADEDAVRFTMRANIHPGGMISVLELLLEERRRRPAVAPRWLSTHPTEEERIARVKRIIANVDSATLARLTQDTPRYRAFHARLMQRTAPVVSVEDGGR